MDCLYEGSFGSLEMKNVILGILHLRCVLGNQVEMGVGNWEKKSLEFKKEVWAAEIVLGGISL